MPHPIFEISELTQVIIDYCLPRNKGSLVSLACTCRALEEQALSTLWSEQSSLVTLVKSTLPPGILPPSKPLPKPTNEEWDKFRRYASWMRRLSLVREARIPEEVFCLMSLGLTEGVVCPGLRSLHWEPHRSDDLPFFRLLLSPKLTTISLNINTVSAEDFSILQQLITELGTFHLRDLRLEMPEKASRRMESAASSAVLQFGPALKKLTIYPPLSDTAIRYIMLLPNLTTWYAVNGPPRTPNLSLSNHIFPRLNHLSLAKEASFEWLTFFTIPARHIPSGQSSHPPLRHGPIERLRQLTIVPDVIIDATFTSRIIQFRRLTSLTLKSACYTVGGCAFKLTDDNIAEIAAALPRLEKAMLGRACPANSCQTTVTSLVSLSTRCKNLRFLDIHFNTANLREDLDSLSADLRLDSLRTVRTSNKFHLYLSKTPYTISEDDVVPVLRGFRRIFPSLVKIWGESGPWDKLNLRLPEA